MMSKQCVCGVCLTLPNVFVLDCNHVFCQGCARIWTTTMACPRCHVEDALGRLSTSDGNENILDHLAQFFCLKTKELSAEKHNTLLSESFSTPSPRKPNSTHDTMIQKYKVNENGTGGPAVRKASPGGLKRNAVEDDTSTLVDGGNAQTLTPSSNARKRQKRGAIQEDDCSIFRSVDKECVSFKKTEELKLHLDQAHVDLETGEKAYKDRLEALKQQAADLAKKAKDMKSEYAREARKQAERIRGLVSDLDGQYVQLASAKKTIQELKSISKDDKLALRKAEKKASDFEAWGRRTKTHYQDIIKQMEANQPRSDSTARSSSYLRKHLQELPTLRPVHPPKDLDHDEEEYPFTPKKRRESAPIIMTPLRPSASSYVGLTQSRQQPPKFEFD